MESIRYIAKIDNLREVALLGHAAPGIWQKELDRARLRPFEFDGKSQILITAIDAKWMGVRFRECAIGVFVEPRDKSDNTSGWYMPRSFNTSRLFSMIERKWFHTPYAHEPYIEVNDRFPASICLGHDDNPVFHACMSPTVPNDERKAANSEDEIWEGPIFIPPPVRRPQTSELFFVKLAGYTLSYPFDPANDVLQINPPDGSAVFQALVDADFSAIQWEIRSNATHARSRTFTTRELGWKMP